MPQKEGMRDLVEFFAHWQAEREKMLELTLNDALSQEERNILHSMIFIIDRVGPKDIDP